jgi:tricorn protease
VFEKDYQLWLYDVASKKAEKLNLALYRNNVLSKEKDFDVKGAISYFDVSPDGKKMAFTSRGEIFVSDIDGKFIQQISKGSAERAMEIKWLNDNRTLLYNQTKDGFQNWYTIAANGSTPPKQITADKKHNRSIVLNKKRSMAVYLSGRDEVKLLDLKTMQPKSLAKMRSGVFKTAIPVFLQKMITCCLRQEETSRRIFLYTI